MRILYDVVVLGGGIVGVSTAVHLQMRGRSVLLVDRRAPGAETSFGNAGVIQSEAVFPYLFPRTLRELLSYAADRSPRSHYHAAHLLRLMNPFIRYWRHSSARAALAIAQARFPFIAEARSDHMMLAGLAGVSNLLEPTGWTQVYGNALDLDLAQRSASELYERFDVPFERLDREGLARHESGIQSDVAGGIHYPTPLTVRDPVDLTNAYLSLFEALGGKVAEADANTLTNDASGWNLATTHGAVHADQAVVALGPWSVDVTKKFGYRPPMFVKRGYHVHFAVRGDASLGRPVLDVEGGYVLAPMRNGIRLTTGAEFADRDASATPVQLARAEPLARAFFPALGERLHPAPWLGSRPCLPDMLPVVGRAPGQTGLWMNFGHGHHGLTLGPTTGRLLAQMMTGEELFTDPTPLRADRF